MSEESYNPFDVQDDLWVLYKTPMSPDVKLSAKARDDAIRLQKKILEEGYMARRGKVGINRNGEQVVWCPHCGCNPVWWQCADELCGSCFIGR